MALPLGHWLRLTLLGSAGSDTWSTSVWFDLGNAYVVPTVAQLDTLVAAALTDFDSKVWSAASNPYKAACSTGTKLTGARGLTYTNNVLDQSDTHNITPIPGTGTSNHPMYVALVVTTQTGLAGRRNRGRMYLPATGLAADATNGLQNGSPAAYANNIASWLNNRAAWATGATWIASINPVVMTQTGSTPQQINNVRMDNKFDTQRGRENKIIATVTANATVT